MSETESARSRNIDSSGLIPMPPAMSRRSASASLGGMVKSPPTRSSTASPTCASRLHHRAGAQFGASFTASSTVGNDAGEEHIEKPPSCSTPGAWRSTHCPARNVNAAASSAAISSSNARTVGVSALLRDIIARHDAIAVLSATCRNFALIS
jgi:hypothetical protein